MPYGSPTPTIGVVALSTVAASLIAASTVNPAGNSRRFLYACSSLAWAIVGSSTIASSTLGALVPANVPFQLDAAITTGAIFGIAPVGTAPIVSTLVF